jgi:hypothetical protein
MMAEESAPARQMSAMFASAMPPLATILCSAKLDGLFEFTGYKLVQGTGDQCLIGNPFLDGTFL